MAALCFLGTGTALGRSRTLAFTPGSYVAAPRFHVTYVGSGQWSTAYHSTPANPGGNPDTNDAHDSSSPHWALKFVQTLRLSAATRNLTGATGATSATGRVAHTHIDGLYAFDDASISCDMADSTTTGQSLSATLGVAYLGPGQRVQVTALNPVGDALELLPQECPGQTDSLDGLADNYFTPGFSFAPGYGPERWFRSRPVLIPLAILRRASVVTVHLGPGPGATPPADCAVPGLAALPHRRLMARDAYAAQDRLGAHTPSPSLREPAAVSTRAGPSVAGGADAKVKRCPSIEVCRTLTRL